MHSLTAFILTDREAIQELDAKLKEERKQAGELVRRNCFYLNLREGYEYVFQKIIG